MEFLRQQFPILHLIGNYSTQQFSQDLIAALVVTIMLIPQSLAYSMLAGLPPQHGLYASITPLVVYALLGSSTCLAVGPVAIASVMTASSLNQVTQSGVVGYLDGAIILALLSGAFLLLLGFFRFGFIANFLSHSVVSGFITAAGLVIALSQFKYILGVQIEGQNFFAIAHSLWEALFDIHGVTFALGLGSIMFLLWSRRYCAPCLVRCGCSPQLAATLSKIAPIIGVIITSLLVIAFQLEQSGVKVVGKIPQGMGNFGLPNIHFEAVKQLWIPAVLISIIGYVESMSVGRTLAAKRKQKIIANQELKGLGAANLASGLSGAFPVTGGFARSVVNFDAGAATQLAGLFTACGIAIASLLLTPFLYYLPIAMLAATIIVAVLSLVDFGLLRRAWRFSKSDFAAMSLTIAITLLMGVEAGVASGIIASIILHLYHTSKPHIAELGLLDDTEHFRNVKHYCVETDSTITILRIDESLLFSNTNFLEEEIETRLAQRTQLKHLVLHLGAVNTIDLSALEMLENINRDLLEQGITLHIAEMKIPVKKLLDSVHFIQAMSGKLYLTPYQAYQDLSQKNV